MKLFPIIKNWIVIFVLPVMCILPDLTEKFIKSNFLPSPVEILGRNLEYFKENKKKHDLVLNTELLTLNNLNNDTKNICK